MRMRVQEAAKRSLANRERQSSGDREGWCELPIAPGCWHEQQHRTTMGHSNTGNMSNICQHGQRRKTQQQHCAQVTIHDECPPAGRHPGPWLVTKSQQTPTDDSGVLVGTSQRYFGLAWRWSVCGKLSPCFWPAPPSASLA